MPPKRLKLCQCRRCSEQFTCRDAKTGKQVKGVYLTEAKYLVHQRQEQRRRYEEVGGNGDDEAMEVDDVEMAILKATMSGGRNGDGFFNSPRVAPNLLGDEVDLQGKSSHTKSNSRGSVDPLNDLLSLEILFQQQRDQFHQTNDINITFDVSPSEVGPGIPELPFAVNRSLLEYQHSLNHLRHELAGIAENNQHERKAQLGQQIEEELSSIHTAIAQAWESHKANPVSFKSDVTPTVKAKKKLVGISTPLFACLATVVALSVLAGLSREYCRFTLVMMKAVVASACMSYAQYCGFTASGAALPDPVPAVTQGEHWPNDIRAAIRALELDPDVLVIATCPKCRTTYLPKTGSDPRYPTLCTFQEFPDQPTCGARLVKKDGQGELVPIVPYLYQPMEAWLNGLLSRKSIVEAIQTTTASWEHKPREVTDMLWGDALQTLEGIDKRPFMKAPPNELRLIFTLNIDWFNPFGRRTAGKHGSTGAIYLICANLPKHLRYRPENVYLAGLIPGPEEPNVDQINGYLEVLVDALVRFWNTGVFYEKTGLHPNGCRVRAMVVALVCDILGARKAAGFASHSADLFCNYCYLKKEDIANFDKAQWEARTKEEHMEHALRYKTASTKSARNKAFQNGGVRCSAFLRLPYCDPIRLAVVDSMHNLLLGNLKHHCREVLGMDSGAAPHKSMKLHDTATQQKVLTDIADAVKKGKIGEITDQRKSYVVAFVRWNHVHVGVDSPTKQDLAEALVTWRKNNAGVTLRIPPALDDPIYDYPLPGEKKVALNKFVLGEVLRDVKKTTFPSWIPSPPQHLGAKKNGKLSADQWRTVCTISFVISLIRLWGRDGDDSEDRKKLDNFMALVAAVRYATKRAVTEESICIFEEEMTRYLNTVVELFSNTAIVPNHHLSLHLPEFLRRLGPVHGWWTFAFERYNGIIQRFNTNNKFGELEATFMRTFCRGGSLKALLQEQMEMASGRMRTMMDTIMVAFDRAFPTVFRGSLSTDLLGLGDDGFGETEAQWVPHKAESTLHPTVYPILSEILDATTPSSLYNARVQDVDRIMWHGVDFSGVRASKGNAQILFRGRQAGDVETKPMAGQIDSIFVHSRVEPMVTEPVVEHFLVVRRYRDLSNEEALQDPYRRYPRLHTWLCFDDFDDEPYVIRKRDIVSHAATCSLEVDEKKWRVIVSLDRN